VTRSVATAAVFACPSGQVDNFGSPPRPDRVANRCP
jgi:hypothetical protein